MIIDFNNMDAKTVHEFRGGTGIAHLKKFENELGKIMLGRLEPGGSVGFHAHETNSEAIYIVSGTASFIYDPDSEIKTQLEKFTAARASAAGASSPNYDASSDNIQSLVDSAINETVSAGGCHYCPKGHSHSMINKGEEDIIFFAVIPEQ